MTWISITCDLRDQNENITVIGVSSISDLTNHPDWILAFSCGIAGCVVGILLTLTIRWYKHRSHRGNTQTPPMFSNPNQAIILDNFHVYSDVEDTVKMAVKATQVPSLYDKSPTSVRSRSSNVYHELSDKVYNFHSTSFIQKPSSRTSSASDNSITNKTSRGSSRSSAGSYLNDNAARRGSDESKRYYELEKRPDNVMNNSMNDIY
ncbi:uncharacterized protein LOC130047856 [Ostrea edulis]|uniref:uncharacterized protein LOC130047856 n=1 Tax=Ostrea edulis TaxID=37623 RepID=UPI0024AF243A|nr:uncharacterized protein LOC130047856 [Ostrea edulis]